MKRLFLTLLLCLLIFCGIADARMLQGVAGSSPISGVTYTDCSQFPTGAALYWTGDHISGTEYACTSLSTTLNGSKSGVTVVASGTDPGTVSPTSGGNCVKATANSQYIRWAVTGANIFSSSEGRIEMDVYLDETTNSNFLFRQLVDVNNYLRFSIDSTNHLVFTFVGQSSSVSVTTTATIPDQTWTNIKVRWSVANNKISAKIGSNSWEDDADADTVTAFASEPGYVTFLSDTIADSTYIDNIIIYKTSGL